MNIQVKLVTACGCSKVKTIDVVGIDDMPGSIREPLATPRVYSHGNEALLPSPPPVASRTFNRGSDYFAGDRIIPVYNEVLGC